MSASNPKKRLAPSCTGLYTTLIRRSLILDSPVYGSEPGYWNEE